MYDAIQLKLALKLGRHQSHEYIQYLKHKNKRAFTPLPVQYDCYSFHGKAGKNSKPLYDLDRAVRS